MIMTMNRWEAKKNKCKKQRHQIECNWTLATSWYVMNAPDVLYLKRRDEKKPNHIDGCVSLWQTAAIIYSLGWVTGAMQTQPMRNCRGTGCSAAVRTGSRTHTKHGGMVRKTNVIPSAAVCSELPAVALAIAMDARQIANNIPFIDMVR